MHPNDSLFQKDTLLILTDRVHRFSTMYEDRIIVKYRLSQELLLLGGRYKIRFRNDGHKTDITDSRM